MQALMPPVDTADNKFHDGDPFTGVEGTLVTAEHLNNVQGAIRDVQAELISILTLAEVSPDSSVMQLLNALKVIFQAKDSTLSALANLAGGVNKLPYFTDVDVLAQTNLTSVGRDIIGKGAVADVLTYLGLRGVAGLGTPTGALASGIIRIPMYNGNTVETLILQWMAAPALAAGGNATITFPTGFPNALLSLMATGGATAAGVPGINTFSIGATSCRIYNQSMSASTQAGAIWALGK